MNVAGYTATGPREANEDNYYAYDFSGLASFTNDACAFAVVSDGMGGYQGGDVASSIVITEAERYLGQLLEMAEGNQIELDAPAALDEIVQKAHARILEAAEENDGRSMGATFVGAFVSPTHAWIGHVGDSRAYLVRDGQAEQITEDHSQVGRMLFRGMITEEEAQNHPERNKIEQALGFTILETEINEVELEADDALLLCSDGVYTVLDSAKLASIVQKSRDAQQAAEQAVKASLSAGTDDNTTAVILFPGREAAYRSETPTLVGGEVEPVEAAAEAPTATLSNTPTRRNPRAQAARAQGSHGAANKREGRSAQRTPTPRVRTTSSKTQQKRRSAGGGFQFNRNMIIPAAIAAALILAAIGIFALANRGGTETGPVEAPASSSTVQPTTIVSSSSQSSSSATTASSAPAGSEPVSTNTVLYYVDMNENARAFDNASNGVNSPAPVILAGSSVLFGESGSADADGTMVEYRALDSRYEQALIDDVAAYNAGSTTFTSDLAQICDPSAYLSTIQSIAAFFETATYTIDGEITELIVPTSSFPSSGGNAVSAESLEDTTGDATDTETGEATGTETTDVAGTETVDAAGTTTDGSTTLSEPTDATAEAYVDTETETEGQ